MFLHNIIMSSIRTSTPTPFASASAPSASASTLTLPIPQAHFIWYCAWLSVPSAIYAYVHPATTHFAPIPAAVFATSLNYWRNPIRNSWRRTLDIAVVSTGLSHHMYYALTRQGIEPSTTRTTYLGLIGVSAISYIVSEYYSRRYCPPPPAVTGRKPMRMRVSTSSQILRMLSCITA